MDCDVNVSAPAFIHHCGNNILIKDVHTLEDFLKHKGEDVSMEDAILEAQCVSKLWRMNKEERIESRQCMASC